VGSDGVCWLYHGCCGLRSDPASGVRTLITDPAVLPEVPWRPTAWGKAELKSMRGDEP
jgi:hypothetical protein